jgi:hypothetical protein
MPRWGTNIGGRAHQSSRSQTSSSPFRTHDNGNIDCIHSWCPIFLLFLTELVLTVLLFLTELVLTVLLFLTTELGLAALVFLTELVLIVLPFFTELVLTELKNSFLLYCYFLLNVCSKLMHACLFPSQLARSPELSPISNIAITSVIVFGRRANVVP